MLQDHNFPHSSTWDKIKVNKNNKKNFSSITSTSTTQSQTSSNQSHNLHHPKIILKEKYKERNKSCQSSYHSYSNSYVNLGLGFGNVNSRTVSSSGSTVLGSRSTSINSTYAFPPNRFSGNYRPHSALYDHHILDTHSKDLNFSGKPHLVKTKSSDYSCLDNNLTKDICQSINSNTTSNNSNFINFTPDQSISTNYLPVKQKHLHKTTSLRIAFRRFCHTISWTLAYI